MGMTQRHHRRAQYLAVQFPQEPELLGCGDHRFRSTGRDVLFQLNTYFCNTLIISFTKVIDVHYTSHVVEASVDHPVDLPSIFELPGLRGSRMEGEKSFLNALT